MTTITMSSIDINLNEIVTPITFYINKNLSTSTTFIESSSLADLCKNFHVSFYFIINSIN